MFDQVVVTLFEGHYHYGVAALINSLHTHKFSGLVLVGYRGDKPEWVNRFEAVDESTFKIGLLYVQFKAVNTSLHFGYYKPYFLKEALNISEGIKKVFYFDPDIVINTDWGFYDLWTDGGVALCLDASYAFLHANHPWRNEWKKLFTKVNNEVNSVDWYVNSGYIGIRCENSLILQRWIDVTEVYIAAGKNIKSFDQQIGHSAFKGDQDLLNAAITISPGLPYSIIGKEGMGFEQPAYVMSHAIGDGIKPWKRNFLKNIIVKGIKPSVAEKDFFKHIDSPIRIFNKWTAKLKKLNMNAAIIIGRFWSI